MFLNFRGIYLLPKFFEKMFSVFINKVFSTQDQRDLKPLPNKETTLMVVVASVNFIDETLGQMLLSPVSMNVFHVECRRMCSTKKKQYEEQGNVELKTRIR